MMKLIFHRGVRTGLMGLDAYALVAGGATRPSSALDLSDKVHHYPEVQQSMSYLYHHVFSTIAPLRFFCAFLPLVKKSEMKCIVFIASILASSHIAFLMPGQLNAYSVANAALNMLTHKCAATLKYDGVVTAACTWRRDR
jgi:NAD(P)-dependent dehydrogenase (short-subunit alcohol dehydrogenase family)